MNEQNGDPMNEPGGWTTPEGWGGQPQQGGPAPDQPTYGQPGYDQQPTYGQPAYGQQPAWNQPPGWGAGPYGAMPPKPGVVPLRPLGLGELLDGAVAIIRRYPRPSLGLAALVAIVTMLVQVLLQLTAFRPFLTLDTAALETGDTEAFTEAIGAGVVGGMLALVLAVLSGAVLAGAITAVVGRAVLGKPMSFREAIAEVRPVLLKLVGLSLLVGLIVLSIVLLGTALGVAIIAVGGATAALAGVPLILLSLALAVYVYVRLSLAPSALVLERAGLMTSLRRSAVLVKGDWWRVFGILLLTVMIAVFVSAVIQAPFEVLGAGGLGSLFDPDADLLAARQLILSAIGGAIASTLVSPFMTGVTALLYVDRRMRAEGLDVTLAAAAAAGTGTGPATP